MWLKRHGLHFLLLGIAQCSIALPPATDLGQSGAVENNTLTTTPVSLVQPLESFSRTPSKVPASLTDDLLKKINALEQQVQELQGQVEVLKHDWRQRQSTPPAAQTPARTITPLTPSMPVTAVTPALPLPIATQVTRTAIITPEVQEKNTYEGAYRFISAHAYADAREALSEYLKIYGKTGQYAAHAQYWLCELMANEPNYTEALTCFSTWMTNYPQASKMPDVLLKLGIINQRLGNDAAAQLWFTRLQHDFPQSTSAQAVQEYV